MIEMKLPQDWKESGKDEYESPSEEEGERVRLFPLSDFGVSLRAGLGYPCTNPTHPNLSIVACAMHDEWEEYFNVSIREIIEEEITAHTYGGGHRGPIDDASEKQLLLLATLLEGEAAYLRARVAALRAYKSLEDHERDAVSERVSRV